jgi:hypothetical protein
MTYQDWFEESIPMLYQIQVEVHNTPVERQLIALILLREQVFEIPQRTQHSI